MSLSWRHVHPRSWFIYMGPCCPQPEGQALALPKDRHFYPDVVLRAVAVAPPITRPADSLRADPFLVSIELGGHCAGQGLQRTGCAPNGRSRSPS